MENVLPYIVLLRQDLLNKFSEIDPTIGPNTILRNQDYKRLATVVIDFLEASENFAAQQGISFQNKSVLRSAATISDTTIERVLTSTWMVKQPIEKRVFQTLNKLSIFCGYTNWEDFFYQKKIALDSVHDDLSSILIETVHHADAAEFSAYKALPLIDLGELQKYFLTGGSAYKRIYNLLVRHKLRQWVINDPTNPSDYKTYSASVKQIAKDTAIVVTDEWWYLRWVDMTTFKTPVIYDTRNTQTFLLKRMEDNSWKVDSTDYPTYGALTYLKKHFKGRRGR